MIGKRLQYFIVAAMSVVVVAQAVQLAKIKRMMRPGSGLPAAGELPPSRFHVGESLLEVRLQDAEGRPVSLTEALSVGDDAIFVFYTSNCTTCGREMAELADYVELYGGDRLVAVDCARNAPGTRLQNLGRARQYVFGKDNVLSHKVFYLPQVVTVNRCGSITGAYKGLSGVPSSEANRARGKGGTGPAL